MERELGPLGTGLLTGIYGRGDTIPGHIDQALTALDYAVSDEVMVEIGGLGG